MLTLFGIPTNVSFEMFVIALVLFITCITFIAKHSRAQQEISKLEGKLDSLKQGQSDKSLNAALGLTGPAANNQSIVCKHCGKEITTHRNHVVLS